MSHDKLRAYQDLWLKIAAADGDKPIQATCAASFSKRLIQAVRKEKSLANNCRDNLDMPRYGKMTSEKTPIPGTNKVQITFRLSYNGDQL